jgi:glycosyltransferase involved in cell wall biosynthesis
MRILFLSPNSAIGGAEAVLIEDMVALSRLGHEVSLIIPNKGKIIESIADHRIEHYIVPFDWWITEKQQVAWVQQLRFLRGFRRSALSICSIVKKIQPDVIVTNTIATPVAAWAACLCQKKHVWYVHELGKEDHSLYFMYGEKRSYCLIEKLSHRIIANSRLVENKLRNFIKNKPVHTLYCSVNIPDLYKSLPIENFYTIERKTPLEFVIASRVSEGKRQEDAIKAIEILNKQYRIAAHLTVLGDRGGAYSERLKAYVAEKELGNYITFINFTDDIYEYYKQSDFVLVCSRCEAFGRVTVEAMKLGKIVFASNTGANPELIGDNERGILYEVGNEQDLVEKIVYYLPQKEYLQETSEKAYNWSWGMCNEEMHIKGLLGILQSA